MSQNVSNIPVYKQNYAQNYGQNNTANNQSFSAGAISNGSIVENNPILKQAAKAKENDGGGFFANFLIATAGMFGLNEFLNRNLQGDYDKTILKKMEDGIDNIAAKPKAQKGISYVSKKMSQLKQWLEKKELYQTLINKQSLGGPTVESQAAGVRGHLATRGVEAIKKYIDVQTKAGNGSAADVQNLKNLLTRVEKESYKHLDEIVNGIKNSGADTTKILSKKPWWGFGIVKNKVNLQEILNKYNLVKNYKNLPNAAGKMPSIGQRAVGTMMRTAECITNGMFGGKGLVLIQSIFIAMALQEARKAEKGEKTGSFFGSLFEQMSYIGAIGLQMRVVNALAGLKFIGWDKSSHTAYQAAMKAVNEAAKTGDAAAYNAAKNTINNIKSTALNGKKLSFFQKVLKGIGNIFSFGRLNETIRPLKGIKASWAPWALKTGLGYAGRGAFLFFAVIPVIASIAKNIGYAIFGRPTKTIAREKAKEEAEKLAAQEEQEKTTQEQNQHAVNTQPQQPASMQPQNPQQTQQTAKPGNLLETMQNMKNNPIASQSIYQAGTQTAKKSPEEEAGIKRTYVPNAVLGIENPVNPATSRAAQIDAVLRQADIAEANAQKYL